MATTDRKVLELVVFNLREGSTREELLGTVDASGCGSEGTVLTLRLVA